MTTPKLTVEQKFKSLRDEAKDTYNILVEFGNEFKDIINDEDKRDIDVLTDELHRIRKALKPKRLDKKTGEIVVRPTTMEYLRPFVKRLKDVSKDLSEIMEDYNLSDISE